MKKKKFYFKVNLCIRELSSVPLVSGILFTKIRVSGSKKFTEFTNRSEVRNHCVMWNKTVDFDVKITADSRTCTLQSTLCRLSVRKEVKGGRSTQKLGYIDLNLAEFAGQGTIAKNFILEGYSDKHRLDNSTLSISIHMSLISGDPLFKVPTVLQENDTQLQPDSNGEVASPAEEVNMNILPGSLSTGSVTQVPSATTADSVSLVQHTRNGSHASDVVKASSSILTVPSGGHTKAASIDCVGHTRTPSAGSAKVFLSLRKPGICERDERIDSTRVDTSDVVDEILDKMSLDDTNPEEGLKLYIGKDGSASVTGHNRDSINT